MGLATIDPQNHKVQTKLDKILKFGVNRLSSKQDTANWKCQNFQRNVWPSGRCVQTAYISLLILTFLNHFISVKTGLNDTKLGDFVNSGVLFLTMWINSCLSHNLHTCTFSVWDQAIMHCMQCDMLLALHVCTLCTIYFLVKIGKFGFPYFHNFAKDSSKTSHMWPLTQKRS